MSFLALRPWLRKEVWSMIYILKCSPGSWPLVFPGCLGSCDHWLWFSSVVCNKLHQPRRELVAVWLGSGAIKMKPKPLSLVFRNCGICVAFLSAERICLMRHYMRRPPGRSRWLWTLMNFTSNFDALISMVLRFKLRPWWDLYFLYA